MHTRDICWAFGGYPYGTLDTTLSRRVVLSFLSAVEFIIANNSYYGDPDKIITHINNDYSTSFNYQHTLIMGRHEGIDKLVKDFKFMSGTCRHGWESHNSTFYAVNFDIS